MSMLGIWHNIKKFKWVRAVIGFALALFAGLILFVKGKTTYDAFDKDIRKIKKKNKQLVGELNDYSDRRLRFFKRTKERESKKT